MKAANFLNILAIGLLAGFIFAVSYTVLDPFLNRILSLHFNVASAFLAIIPSGVAFLSIRFLSRKLGYLHAQRLALFTSVVLATLVFTFLQSFHLLSPEIKLLFTSAALDPFGVFLFALFEILVVIVVFFLVALPLARTQTNSDSARIIKLYSAFVLLCLAMSGIIFSLL